MPYVTDDKRKELDPVIESLVKVLNKLNHAGAETDARNSDGNINYTICELLMRVFGCDQAPRYTKFNALIGALECAKLEIYRRAIGPYEDKAIAKNGDIAVFPGLVADATTDA